MASGGMAVLRAASLSKAPEIFSRDPGVCDGVFVGEVRPLCVVFGDPAFTGLTRRIEAPARPRETDADSNVLNKPGAAR